MLTIRMKRTGRKGHAQFRVVVQDSRFSPDSGRVVAHIGSYNPHSKATILDKEKAQSYLDNGAQPSDRVIAILKKEGVKLPGWVSESAPKSRAIRNQDKLRRNRPVEETVAETPVEEPATKPADEPVEPETAEVEASEPEAEVTPTEESTPVAADAPAPEVSEEPAKDKSEPAAKS